MKHLPLSISLAPFSLHARLCSPALSFRCEHNSRNATTSDWAIRSFSLPSPSPNQSKSVENRSANRTVVFTKEYSSLHSTTRNIHKKKKNRSTSKTTQVHTQTRSNYIYIYRIFQSTRYRREKLINTYWKCISLTAASTNNPNWITKIIKIIPVPNSVNSHASQLNHLNCVLHPLCLVSENRYFETTHIISTISPKQNPEIYSQRLSETQVNVHISHTHLHIALIVRFWMKFINDYHHLTDYLHEFTRLGDLTILEESVSLQGGHQNATRLI